LSLIVTNEMLLVVFVESQGSERLDPRGTISRGRIRGGRGAGVAGRGGRVRRWRRRFREEEEGEDRSDKVNFRR